LESNIGSELIVTLAWRSAEFAALGAATLLIIALVVRRYLEWAARTHARVIAAWRPLLTRIAIEGAMPGTFPPLPNRHLPYLMEEWNALTMRCAASPRSPERGRPELGPTSRGG
jgi:hypothetical protein